MCELRLTPAHDSINKAAAISPDPVSPAEGELNNFLNAMANVFGRDPGRCLTELWLNELACMECIPGSEDFSWRSVSLCASAKLANQLIASQLSGTHF
jgi:hypothetical protein